MKITKADCTYAGGAYTYDGVIDTGGEDLAIELDGRLLLVWGSIHTRGGSIDIDGGSISTSGVIITRGGDIDTHGASIYTRGGDIYTRGGHVVTRGGSIDTDGGCIDTYGGYIDTDGGGVSTRGGSIDTDGGYVHTRGGIYTDGGDIRTRGGSIDTVDGDYIHTGESGYIIIGGGSIDTDGGRINGIEPPSLDLQRKRIRAVLDAIDAGGGLDMADWHTCDTTHCIAGWLHHLNGESIDRCMHPSAAGAALCPRAVAHFHASDDEAMAWMREFAG